MTFEDWMLHRGLAPSSAKKFMGAVQGSLSEWAISHSLMVGPLTSFTSSVGFNEVADRIRELPIFQERNARGHNMYSSALSKFSQYLSEGYGSDVEADIDVILTTAGLTETEKRNLVKSRIGQGAFRQKLVGYWVSCAVTGFKDTSVLVASHIKPWRAATNTERLDPFNGLLLVPNLDKVFDAGLVTFGKSGSLVLSPLLTEPDKLGIAADMRVTLTQQHEPYMHFHRTEVFRST